MPMLANEPTADGVPVSRPVAALNVAQLGRLTIENVSVPPSGSLAVGAHEYAVPTVAVVVGAPEIVGGRFAAAVTVIANGGSETLAVPSLTLIAMLLNAPTFAAAGVPVRRPVAVLNVAHVGRFAIVNVSVPPSGSDAVGVNVYAAPTVAVVAGVPEIVGGWFAAPWTVIVKAGSEALAEPSLAVITMPANAPTFAAAGVPVS